MPTKFIEQDPAVDRLTATFKVEIYLENDYFIFYGDEDFINDVKEMAKYPPFLVVTSTQIVKVALTNFKSLKVTPLGASKT